jgi:hypothetical protein
MATKTMIMNNKSKSFSNFLTLMIPKKIKEEMRFNKKLII